MPSECVCIWTIANWELKFKQNGICSLFPSDFVLVHKYSPGPYPAHPINRADYLGLVHTQHLCLSAVGSSLYSVYTRATCELTVATSVTIN